jgi:hypothetical protein
LGNSHFYYLCSFPGLPYFSVAEGLRCVKDVGSCKPGTLLWLVAWRIVVTASIRSLDASSSPPPCATPPPRAFNEPH